MKENLWYKSGFKPGTKSPCDVFTYLGHHVFIYNWYFRFFLFFANWMRGDPIFNQFHVVEDFMFVQILKIKDENLPSE